MTVKSYSPYRALFQPKAYFSSLVQTWPNTGRTLLWLFICSTVPVLCTLVSYIRFYAALESDQSVVLYTGIFLSGFISEGLWSLIVLVLGYLWLGPNARAVEIGVASLMPFLVWGILLLIGGLLLPFPADMAAIKALLEKELQYYNSSDVARVLFTHIQGSWPYRLMLYSGVAAFAYQALLFLLGFRHAGLSWVRTLMAVLVLTFLHVVFQYNLNATWRFLDHGIVTEKVIAAPTE